MIFHHQTKGFTLIELLVVISIISLLSSVVYSSISSVRAKARDAVRKSDLAQIAKALQLYYDQNGNWIGTGSGCGQQQNGFGLFNFVDGTFYLASISSCLQNAGFLAREIIDPTGGRTLTPVSGYAYAKWHCGSPGATQEVYVYAKLETVDPSDTATDGTCCWLCDTSYGMNYYVKVN